MPAHLPAASFPSSVWDGLTRSKQNLYDYANPGPDDWNEMLSELLAVQQYLVDVFTKTGNNIFLNTAVYDDLRVNVNNIRVPTANNPAWVSYKGTEVLSFADQATEGNEERAYFAVQMPHNWKPGTNIVPHVHWCIAGATTANVVWKLTYSWANINGTFASETPITVTGGTGGGSDKHVVATFDPISGSGKTLSSILLCCIRRNSSDSADTLNSAAALLLEVDFHYQIDRFGSKEETSH